MIANTPEKPHFDRIMRIETEIVERKEDLKVLWQSAKETLDGNLTLFTFCKRLPVATKTANSEWKDRHK